MLPADNLPHHLANGAEERLLGLILSVGLAVYRRRLYRACIQRRWLRHWKQQYTYIVVCIAQSTRLSLHCSLLIGGKILKNNSTPRHRMEIKLFYSIWKHVEKLLHSWNLFGTRETICWAASKAVEEEMLIRRHPNKHWASFLWKSRSSRALEIIRNTWKMSPYCHWECLRQRLEIQHVWKDPIASYHSGNFSEFISGAQCPGVAWAEFPKFSVWGLKGELCR